MTRVAVTGGSGKAGQVIVRDLAAHGHEVLNIDLKPSPESYSPEAPIPFLQADVTDFGQALEALEGGSTLPGIEAVVHLAARLLGVERNDARAPVHPAAGVRTGGRAAHPPRDELRAVKGRRRGDGAAVSPLERDPDHRAAVLERDGAPGLRALPGLSG